MNEIIRKKIISSLDRQFRGQGIYNGNIGKAFLSGIMFKETNDEIFSSLFQKSLDEIGSNIALVKRIDFKEGIAGIGWGIEWLCQNKFLENVNSDEILEDFDDLIYKTIIYTQNDNFTLLNGNTGLANYFILRIKSSNKGAHRFKKIVNRECLTILEDRIKDYLKAKINISLTNYEVDDMIACGDILKTFSSIHNCLIAESDSIVVMASIITENILVDFTAKIDSMSSIPLNNSVIALYLASSFLYASKKVQSVKYQYIAKQILAKLTLVIHKQTDICNTTDLFNFLRVHLLIYLYDKSMENRETLLGIYSAINQRELDTLCINDCVAYTLVGMIESKTELLFNAHDLIFLNNSAH